MAEQVGRRAGARERAAVSGVIAAARAYAAITHGNLGDRIRYRRREEARDQLLDALARLDAVAAQDETVAI